MSLRPARAFSILELLISSAIAGLLFSITLLIYTVEARTVAKANVQADVLQNLQVLQARLTEDGIACPAASLSVDPVASTVAFANARDGQGILVQDSQGRLLWQRYHVYYWQSSDNTVRLADVAIASPGPEVVALPDYDDGSGAHPLAFYAANGRKMAERISAFKPSASIGIFSIVLQGQQLRPQGTTPEVVTLRTVISPRN